MVGQQDLDGLGAALEVHDDLHDVAGVLAGHEDERHALLDELVHARGDLHVEGALVYDAVVDHDAGVLQAADGLLDAVDADLVGEALVGHAAQDAVARLLADVHLLAAEGHEDVGVLAAHLVRLGHEGAGPRVVVGCDRGDRNDVVLAVDGAGGGPDARGQDVGQDVQGVLDGARRELVQRVARQALVQAVGHDDGGGRAVADLADHGAGDGADVVQHHVGGLLHEGQALQHGVAVLRGEVGAGLVGDQRVRAVGAEGAADDAGHGRQGFGQSGAVQVVGDHVATRTLAQRHDFRHGRDALGVLQAESRGKSSRLLDVGAGRRADHRGVVLLHLSDLPLHWITNWSENGFARKGDGKRRTASLSSSLCHGRAGSHIDDLSSRRVAEAGGQELAGADGVPVVPREPRSLCHRRVHEAEDHLKAAPLAEHRLDGGLEQVASISAEAAGAHEVGSAVLHLERPR